MDGRFDLPRPVDARYASWLASSSSATVGYHICCGMSLPEREEMPHGRGPGWHDRAVAAVLRECYARGLEEPALEEVEVVALSVLPAPERDDERPRPPFMPGPEERWEEAVRDIAEEVRDILRHGPASGAAGGEVLFAGGVLEAEVAGLEIEQRVDLLWRRPDGILEAVLVFEERFGPRGPRPAGEDWRCVLAAAAVRALHGENPDVHAVWVSEGVARVERVPEEILDEKLRSLARTLERAGAAGGPVGAGESVFYRLSGEGADARWYAPPGGPRGRGRPGSFRKRSRGQGEKEGE